MNRIIFEYSDGRRDQAMAFTHGKQEYGPSFLQRKTNADGDPETDAEMAARVHLLGVQIIREELPEGNVVELGEPVENMKDGWKVIRYPNAILETVDNASAVRAERDRLLTACDWTQLADSPLDAASMALWQNYRQALRDIPQQAGFPDSVEWPEKPAT